MEKTGLIFALVTLLLLNFSCASSVSPEKHINQEDPFAIVTSDSLTFTTGIRAILKDSRGNYWFGSQNEGVCRYDGNTFGYITVKEGLADNQVFSIQEAKDGVIWFGTATGVCSFDGVSVKKHNPSENAYAPNEWKKSEHDLWFHAGNKQGIYRFNGQELMYLAFPDPLSEHSGNIYAVTGIHHGKNNQLWIATYAGVFGFDGNKLTLMNDDKFGFEKEIEKLHVRSILEDSKGRLWIGNNGIGVLLQEKDSLVHFSKLHCKLIPMIDFKGNFQAGQSDKNISLQAVFAIQEDNEGNIWFGDRDSGAWRYDGVTLKNYIIDQKLESQMIWTIYMDEDQQLLFGMASGGVYRFNGNSFESVF